VTRTVTLIPGDGIGPEVVAATSATAFTDALLRELG
jgi:isocitrate/isopropylmalate dehydrogenase